MRKEERRDGEKLVEEEETREGRGGRRERIQEESVYPRQNPSCELRS